MVVEPLVGPSCLRAEIESKKGETGREKPYEGIQTKWVLSDDSANWEMGKERSKSMAWKSGTDMNRKAKRKLM